MAIVGTNIRKKLFIGTVLDPTFFIEAVFFVA
jgi:hypothetical protein